MLTVSVTCFTVSSNTNDKVATKQNFDVQISPNPTDGNSILVVSGIKIKISITINDARGKVIWKLNDTKSNRIEIPSADFVSGTYIVSVISEYGTETLKLIKE